MPSENPRISDPGSVTPPPPATEGPPVVRETVKPAPPDSTVTEPAPVRTTSSTPPPAPYPDSVWDPVMHIWRNPDGTVAKNRGVLTPTQPTIGGDTFDPRYGWRTPGTGPWQNSGGGVGGGGGKSGGDSGSGKSPPPPPTDPITTAILALLAQMASGGSGGAPAAPQPPTPAPQVVQLPPQSGSSSSPILLLTLAGVGIGAYTLWRLRKKRGEGK